MKWNNYYVADIARQILHIGYPAVELETDEKELKREKKIMPDEKEAFKGRKRREGSKKEGREG